MSLTALRNQIFKVVDRVIKTGIPVAIERKEHRLKDCAGRKKEQTEK